MKRSSWAACVGLVAIGGMTASLGACSSDGSSSSSSSSSGSPGTDGGADATPAPTGRMTVAVYAPPLDGTFPNPPPAMPNANVGVDLPGGEHRDLVAGADGKLTVEGIDWSKGTASLVGFADKKYAYAVADVGPDTFAKIPHPAGADVALFLFPTQEALYPVKLTVSFTNMDAAASEVVLGASNGLALAGTKGTPVQLLVRPGVPFTIVARQAKVMRDARNVTVTETKWVKFDQPAVTASGPLALDLAAGTPITPTTLTTKVSIPGGDTGPLGGTSGVTSFAVGVGEQLPLALVQKVAVTPDKSAFDVTLEAVDVQPFKPFFVYAVNAPSGAFGNVWRASVPAAGETFSDLPLPPAAPAAAVSLKAPIALDGFAPDAVARLVVADSAAKYQLTVDAPPGSKTMHVPTLPAGARPGAGSVTGQLIALTKNDEALGRYLGAAGTGSFDVSF